jgi:hypothetical protein
MILALDLWLLPAIAAASSSYLVSLAWERIRPATAPTAWIEGFLALLSFMMGGICAYYRGSIHDSTLEANVIIMFVAGATTTYSWLLLRQAPGVRKTPPGIIHRS